MSIKNSILVMTKVSEYFPLHYEAGAKLLTAVEVLITTEKREDLKILAQGFVAHTRTVLLERLLTALLYFQLQGRAHEASEALDRLPRQARRAAAHAFRPLVAGREAEYVNCPDPGSPGGLDERSALGPQVRSPAQAWSRRLVNLVGHDLAAECPHQACSHVGPLFSFTRPVLCP